MGEIITADEIHKPSGNVPVLKNSFRNNQTVWVLPTRGQIPLRVHVSLRNMYHPMNTGRICVEEEHMEVAAAYEKMIGLVMESPTAKNFPFIWTYEEDNVQPPNVLVKLFDAFWTCIDCGVPMPSDENGAPVDPWVCQNGHRGLDAIGSLYFTKSNPRVAMAYGSPKSNELEFRPLDVTEALEAGSVIECNGLGMGSTLFRKGIFEKVPRPWFVTSAGEHGFGATTQDLYFFRKAKEEAKIRCAIHCGAVGGHLDVKTGVVY